MIKFNKIYVELAALSLVIFALIAYFANFTTLFNKFDQRVIIYFHNIEIKHSLVISKFITNLGYAPFLLFLLVILSVLLVYYKHYKDAIFLFLTTISGLLMNGLFKEIFKKLRPAVEYHQVQVQGYSFPSGHALLSICFYGALIYIIFWLVKTKLLRYTLSALLILLIILIGFSRVYLGVHYPTDVLGSWTLGAFIIFFWVSFLNTKFKEND